MWAPSSYSWSKKINMQITDRWGIIITRHFVCCKDHAREWNVKLKLDSSHLLAPGPLTLLRHLLSCPDHLLLIRINWLSKMSWINGLMSVDLNPKFGKGGMFPCRGAGFPPASPLVCAGLLQICIQDIWADCISLVWFEWTALSCWGLCADS